MEDLKVCEITNDKLPDVQKSKLGFHKIPIKKVGVRNIRVPFKLFIKNGKENFSTIATVSSYCDLNEEVKGINMSRIARTLNDILRNNDNKGFKSLEEYAIKLKDAHGADNIFTKAKFKYIYKIMTPASNINSYEPVDVIFESTMFGNKITNYITVEKVGMSLCPCSKEMSLLKNNLNEETLNKLKENLSDKEYEFIMRSGFGAHNQKSIVNIKIEVNNDNLIYIEDLIDIIDSSVSTGTFSVLKREDEKYITEVSYLGGYIDDNKKFIEIKNAGPKFVEDIARDAANQLNNLLAKNKINDYVVVVNNQESIHSDEIVATAILSAGINLI